MIECKASRLRRPSVSGCQMQKNHVADLRKYLLEILNLPGQQISFMLAQPILRLKRYSCDQTDTKELMACISACLLKQFDIVLTVAVMMRESSKPKL